MTLTRRIVGGKVSDIGKAAGVIVDQRTKKGELVAKYASAHDLRRSFGFRWSRRLMPAVLKELMRHETIETTMKYYVGTNAEQTADVLWEAVGNHGRNAQRTKENAEFTPPDYPG